ncbi:MAG: type II toxin-antitoxin system VapC family toxin, partial [Myxococcaceae bacterium]
MTRELFVDTGGWIAVQIPNDRWHAQAASVLRGAIAGGVPLVTTNHVIGETYSLLVRAHGRPAAWKFLDGIARSTRLERLFVDEPTELEAFELLRR